MISAVGFLSVWCREKAIICATCQKRAAVQVEQSMENLLIVARCHGRVEVVRVDGLAMAMAGHRDDLYGKIFDAIPRRVFLRNWAAYTIRPERPAGRVVA